MKSVSCIIPIYGITRNDNLSYFKQLIESLSLAAIGKLEKYEIILVNDDIDNSPKSLILGVCEQYGLINCTRYIENGTNKGQAYSRNKGAKLAKNKYLHFIDQDDYVSNDFYINLINRGCNSDILISRPFFNVHFKKDVRIIPADSYILNYFYTCSSKLTHLWFLLIINIAYSPGQVLFSSPIFHEVGGFPVLVNKGSDDYGLFFNLVFKTKASFNYDSNALFFYRTHELQNSRICDMSASVREFLDSVEANSIKKRIIRNFKLSPFFSVLTKLFYIIVFKRVK